jgi:hypothetical protein
VRSHVNLQDILIIDKEELIRGLIKLKRKFKVESRRDPMLEACYIYCDHGYVNICIKRVPHIVEYGG